MKTLILICAVIGVALGRSIENVGETFWDVDRLSIAQHTAEFIKSLQEYSENGRSDMTRIQANANAYFDIFFQNLGKFLLQKGYDPLGLPDLVKAFKWTIFSGELSFRTGWLKDLNTIHRVGDVTIKYNNKAFNIKVPIKFDRLRLDYKYRAKFMGLGPAGGLEGNLENVELSADFVIDLHKVEIIMQEFKIQKAGSIKVKWTGGQLIVDWVLSIFTNVTVSLMHPTILNVINNFMGKFITDLLSQINKDLANILG